MDSASNSKLPANNYLRRINKLLFPNLHNRNIKPANLRKDLWVMIFGYLDSKTYFCTIALLNRFFFFLTNEYKYLGASFKTGILRRHNDDDVIWHILKCKNLKKLELNLHVETFNDRKFFSLLNPLNALKDLKVLKICIKINIKLNFDFLTSMKSLEVLKLFCIYISRDTIDFIMMCMICKSKYTSNSKFNLKQLSLKSSKIHINEIIKRSIGLEKISFDSNFESDLLCSQSIFRNNLVNYYLSDLITEFVPSKSLKIIKLPNVAFKLDQNDDFFNYLKNTCTLEQLVMYEYNIILYEEFIDAIFINRSIKVLHLKPFKIINYDCNLGIPYKIFTSLLTAVSQTLIEDFYAVAIVLFERKPSIIKTNFYSVCENPEIIVENFEKFLASSEKIRNLDIKILNLPYKYIVKIADLIIKFAKLRKIEFFAGYNIPNLIDNKIEILELKIEYDDYENYIIFEIFKKLLLKATRIIKIIDYKNTFCFEVEENLQKANISKKLIINNNFRTYYNTSCLFCYSIMILSTRIKDLKELELIECAKQFKDAFGFSELLKEFKSLEILKINEKSEKEIIANFKSFSKIISSDLKKLSIIKLSGLTFEYKSTNLMFKSLANLETLIKLKLSDIQLGKGPWIFYKILGNFLAKSNLLTFNISEIKSCLTYKNAVELAKGLKKNKNLRQFKLQNIFFENKFQNLSVILSSLESKANYEKIFINNIKAKKDCMYFCKPFLEIINNVLFNNKNLRLFFICFCRKYLESSDYRKIFINAIKQNKKLKIIQGLDLEEIFSDKKKTLNVACEYYEEKIIQSVKKNSVFLECCTPLILSELMKTTQPDILSSIIERLFQYKIDTQSLKLKLNVLGCGSLYKYNFIETFSCLKRLTLIALSITQFEFDVIVENIEKLRFLNTVKIINEKNNWEPNSLNINDIKIYSLLEAKNITYLSIKNSTINLYDLSNFPKNIRASSLEKLSLKNISFINYMALEKMTPYFFETVDYCKIKFLKIHIGNSNHLNIIIQELKRLQNLEYLSVNILKDFEKYIIPIKRIIYLLVDNSYKLNKVKVYKYIWDIEDLKKKENLNFIKCSLSIADLMILTEICEKGIMKKINTLDLSDNNGIIGENFVHNIYCIIKALKCCKIIIKNSGCEKEIVQRINNLLKEASDTVKIII
ncbi:hypothetical protein SteCoe_32028 [Stentor coeruleus]|uniref:Uncharacterized protein n=1 Tax=Stentor coeruleus TaxID=5963 RepID=A0A1R2AZZ6_9CILI|nr:hypothetical protein SteCoe_32028 [Stentor coeruleus]